MKKFIFILFICFNIYVSAQINSDSLKYDFSFQFKDGFYLNFEQLKNNKPIDFQQILNFMETYIESEYFDTVKILKFYDEFGILKEINKTQIFGYCIYGKPYIYYADKFNLIPAIGSISYFVTTVLVTRFYNGGIGFAGGFYDYYPSQYYKEPELRQFLLDFKTGKIYDYNTKSVENILNYDNELFEKYKKLSKRKKEKQKFDFIQKFNEKYPLYLFLN